MSLSLKNHAARALAFGLLAGSVAVTASAQDAPRIVSPELFEALESWSSSSASTKAIAVESRPEVVSAYAESLRDVYRGLTVDEHFARTYPETHQAYLAMVEAEQVDDSADFVAYVMAADDQAYAAWQSEKGLGGATFDAFVAQRYPDVVQEAELGSVTPAEQGVSMRDHVAALDQRLTPELDGLLTSLDKPIFKSVCQCWTVATFPHEPDPWQAESTEDTSDEWGWAPKKEREFHFYKAGRGAAKDFNFRRKSRHNVYEASRTRSNYDAQMRIRMLCTDPGSVGGAACDSGGCVGELAMRTAYASRVYEKIDVGGPWSKRSQMRVGDAAALRFDPPGPAPEQKLFEKGVAVAGDYKTNWDAESGLTLLQTVATVAVAVATDGTTAASLLEGNLLSDTYNAIIGLIKKEGSTGDKSVDMQIAYDTAGSAPFALMPNTTLAFDLDTASEMYGRGYGGYSEGWGNIDSSFYMVGVARNYSCEPGTASPSPQAFWLWSRAGQAPQSSATLQNLIKNWVHVELGTEPTGMSDQLGHYP